MGWDFSPDWTSRQDVIIELLRGWEYEGTTIKTLAYKKVPNGLWVVREASGKENRRYIDFYLIRYNRQHGYGYKGMTEEMGPYYWDCPLEFLDLVPSGSPGTNERWRSDVRKRASKTVQRRRRP